MAIVYIHKNIDNEEIFYVGIGKSYHRATSRNKRSKFWHSYVAIHKFESIILFNDITWEEACIKEIELIAQYGRRDLKSGSLVNMTNGGAGGNTMSGRKNASLALYNKNSKGKKGLKLRWINKDGKNSRVLEENIQKFLDIGWSRGSLKTGPNEKRKGTKPWNDGKSGYKCLNISKALKGKSRKTYAKRKIEICTECGKIGDSTYIKGRHVKNCKKEIK